MGADLRVPMDPILDAFGVPVVITRPAPDDAAIQTTGVWLDAPPEEQPFGTDIRRREPRKVLVIARSAVATMPRGTTLQAAETLGGPVRTWRFDALLDVDPDQWSLLVVLVS